MKHKTNYLIRLLFVILLFQLSVTGANAQLPVEWKKTYGPGSPYNISSASDGSNVVVLAEFGPNSAPITFENGTSFSLPVPNSRNLFLARYSADGTLTWNVHFKSSKSIESRKLCLDKAGNIYVLFTSYGDLNINGTPYINKGNDSPFTNIAYYYSVLVKLNSAGVVQWVEPIVPFYNSSLIASNLTIQTDAFNNVFIAGEVSLTCTVRGVTYVPSGNEIIVAKINAAGTCEFIKSIGKKTSDISVLHIDLEIDPSGKLYFMGYICYHHVTCTGSVVIGSRTFTSDTKGGYYFVKMSSSADVLSSNRIDGPVFINNMVVDKDGTIIIGGRYSEASATIKVDGITYTGLDKNMIILIPSSGGTPIVKEFGEGSFDTFCDIGYSTVSDDIYFLSRHYTGVRMFDGIQLNLPAPCNVVGRISKTGVITEAAYIDQADFSVQTGVITPDQKGSVFVGSYTNQFLKTKCGAVSVQTDGNPVGCANVPEKLTTLAIEGATYQWKKNGYDMTGETRSYLETKTGGSYSVERTRNGCVVTSASQNVVINPLPHFSVPPSPTVEGAVNTNISVGSALYFDGYDDYVNVPDFSIPEGPVTIEFWIKQDATATSEYSHILSVGFNGISVYSKPGVIDFQYGYGWSASRTSIYLANPAGWNHVAIVYEGSYKNVNYYINGKLDISFAVSNPFVGSLNGLTIAERLNNRFKGNLHDLRIWKNARSASEILAGINTFSDYSNTNLSGAWKFTEGSGNVSRDLTPAGRNAAIYGCTWANIAPDLNYTWTPPATESSYTGQTIAFNHNLAGVFNYTITGEDLSTGCKTSIGLPITVKERKGANFINPINAGTLAAGQSFEDMQNNTPSNGFYNDKGYVSDDIVYTFTLAAPASVTVSNCADSDIDTYLYLFNESMASLIENDDNGPACSGTRASLMTNLQPGKYYVMAEGYSSSIGNIKTKISVQTVCNPAGAKLQNPVELGTIAACSSVTKTNDNSPVNCFGNDFGQSSDDIFYRFSLSTAQTLNFSTCASGFDTYLTLLDNAGNIIESNDDYGPLCASTRASLTKSLTQGTYFVVTEGFGSYSGSITLTISNAVSCKTSDNADMADNADNADMEKMSVFPNPVTNDQAVTIKLPSFTVPVSVKVTDISGKLVHSFLVADKLSNVQLPDLDSGMYFLTIQMEGKTEVSPIVINNE
jgi:hypothetical protein